MSKERLEEFKKQIDFLDDSEDMDDFSRFIDTLQIMYEDGDLHWIVRHASEQARRVGDLERDYRFGSEQMESLVKRYNHLSTQNKLYRELISYMADTHFGDWDVNGLIARAKELNGGNGDGK